MPSYHCWSWINEWSLYIVTENIYILCLYTFRYYVSGFFYILGSVWLVTFNGIPLSHSALLLHFLFHVFMWKFWRNYVITMLIILYYSILYVYTRISRTMQILVKGEDNTKLKNLCLILLSLFRQWNMFKLNYTHFDRHDITEILLKVALSTINPKPHFVRWLYITKYLDNNVSERYIVGKYIIYLYEPFCPILQQVQMNFPTMYLYCVYYAMSKCPNQPTNCLKRAVTSVLRFYWCPLWRPRLNTVTIFYHR